MDNHSQLDFLPSWIDPTSRRGRRPHRLLYSWGRTGVLAVDTSAASTGRIEERARHDKNWRLTGGDNGP